MTGRTRRSVDTEILIARRWSKVDVHVDGCWEWTGTTNSRGYGRIRQEKRYIAAHRVFYELLVGPVPDGLVLDHLCRVRHCVNPAHLEPVTNRENQLRGATFAARNASKTHCRYGHEFTPENTYDRNRGGRQCLTCERARDARRRGCEVAAGIQLLGEL